MDDALSGDLIHCISQYFLTSTDLRRFGAVGPMYRAAVRLPPSIESIPSSFKIIKSTILCVHSQLPDHSPWIVKLVCSDKGRMRLFNPLAGSPPKSKPLPNNDLNSLNFRVQELDESHWGLMPYERKYLSMDKIAVLRKPGDCFVLLTFDCQQGKFLVRESSDTTWRVLEGLPYGDLIVSCDDLIVREERFYVVDSQGRLIVVNHVDSSVVSVVGDPLLAGGCNKFLVNSNGELLLVDVYKGERPEGVLVNNEILTGCYMILKFNVYKLDENVGRWVELSDLGDRILFLGDNCVFSVSASDIFRNNDRLSRGNCIIFDEQCSYWEDCVPKNKTLGVRVFDLETRIIDELSNHSRISCSNMFWPPPDWVSSSASA